MPFGGLGKSRLGTCQVKICCAASVVGAGRVSTRRAPTFGLGVQRRIVRGFSVPAGAGRRFCANHTFSCCFLSMRPWEYITSYNARCRTLDP